MPIAVREQQNSTLPPASPLTYPNTNNISDQDTRNKSSSKHSEEDGNNDDQDNDLVTTCSCQKYYQGPHHVYHTKKGPYYKKKVHRRKLIAKMRRQLKGLLYYLRTANIVNFNKLILL